MHSMGISIAIWCKTRQLGPRHSTNRIIAPSYTNVDAKGAWKGPGGGVGGHGELPAVPYGRSVNLSPATERRKIMRAQKESRRLMRHAASNALGLTHQSLAFHLSAKWRTDLPGFSDQIMLPAHEKPAKQSGLVPSPAPQQIIGVL
jgi:hypothetical protein